MVWHTAVVVLGLSRDSTCTWCYRSRKIHIVPFFLWESTRRCDSSGTQQCSHCIWRAWRKTSKLLQLLCPYVQPYSHSKYFARSHQHSHSGVQAVYSWCTGLSSLWEATALQLQHVPPAQQVLCMLQHADTHLENTAAPHQMSSRPRKTYFPHTRFSSH